ncbi:FxsA family protein [Paenibacillus sp. P96]|uniref:FxsA family protein n=1 Tax=Paenibacillus zeirhizosphaerae TaxID=2987519 RepID=A0ABT9FT17_9BACL|nr:FxsA family protein [Paenibacillus sp. P96]MDP4097878.1 FxsA family protein [Paenibacillus sp. P96]
MRRPYWFLLLLIPVVELYGFLWVSERIGAGKTILLIIFTSIIGLAMLQFEGRKVVADAKLQMNKGQMPGSKMLDGLCVFLGGSMLVLPGFITDIIGFSLIFPLTRPIYRKLLFKWVEKKMKNGSITFRRF